MVKQQKLETCYLITLILLYNPSNVTINNMKYTPNAIL